jgi:hypothetical protein
MPSNETITWRVSHGPKQMLISTAEVTGPVMDSEPRLAARSDTRVSDAEKWLQNFTAGLHRVIFYGDHVRDVERMGRLMGFEMVREI